MFQTLSNHSYEVVVINEGFIDGGGWNPVAGTFPDLSRRIESLQSPLLGGQAQDPRKFQNLTRAECLQLYSAQYLTDRETVYAVTPEGNPVNASLLLLSNASSSINYVAFEDGIDVRHHPFRGERQLSTNMWLCTERFDSCYAYTGVSGRASLPESMICYSTEDCTSRGPGDEGFLECEVKNCDLMQRPDDIGDWAVGGFSISYCLSKLVPERCELQFSVSILVIVISCNAVKMISMLLCARFIKDEPLITVGDAVASFLDTPDTATEGLCLYSGKDFARRRKNTSISNRAPRPWRYTGRRWYETASKTRWGLTLAM